jgi:HEAT repeat protein
MNRPFILGALFVLSLCGVVLIRPKAVSPVGASTKESAPVVVPLAKVMHTASKSVQPILDELRAASAGPQREARIINLGRIRDRALAPELLDAVESAHLPEDALAVIQWNLIGMADAALVADIAARYERVPDSEVAARLTFIVGRIINDDATDALAGLVTADVPVLDLLAKAALSSLMHIGTPFAAASIARRLDVANEEDQGILANALSRIERVGTQHELIAIAQGKQDATRSVTRIAATAALVHYPDQATLTALARLANDEDQQVAETAKKVLAKSSPQ